MQSVAPKTPRGIQESDVWAAADALLAEGQKPTIEKVRLHMGRGSPNTVAPMLDGWFATLGARLGLNQQTEQLRNSVPNEVLEAAQHLWGQALEHAQQVAVQTLESREQAVQAMEQQLQVTQNQLSQREEGLQAQKAAMDAALKLAQAQREDLSRRLDEMQQQLSERDQLLEKQRADQIALRASNETLRDEHTKALEAAAQERQRLAEQFAGNERRMLADLDRSRQDAEKSKKAQQESERAAALRHEQLLAKHLQSEEALLTARAEQLNLNQLLAVANERVAEFKALLQLQTQAQSQSAEGMDPGAEKPRSLRSLQSRARAQRSQRLPRK